MVCGGVIPPQDYPMLYDSGVAAVFGPGMLLIMYVYSEVTDMYMSTSVVLESLVMGLN